jgi:hypothetical protein
MYDWEFQNYLTERNYKLTNNEYLYICNTCPQISRVKYNSFGDTFEIWTDCNYFKFEVYYKED